MAGGHLSSHEKSDNPIHRDIEISRGIRLSLANPNLLFD